MKIKDYPFWSNGDKETLKRLADYLFEDYTEYSQLPDELKELIYEQEFISLMVSDLDLKLSYNSSEETVSNCIVKILTNLTLLKLVKVEFIDYQSVTQIENTFIAKLRACNTVGIKYNVEYQSDGIYVLSFVLDIAVPLD